jgi:hypothetical protein
MTQRDSSGHGTRLARETFLTSANASHGLDFDAVFARRFIPWLKLQVARIVWGTAQAKRDDVVKLVFGSIKPRLASRLEHGELDAGRLPDLRRIER